VSPTGNRSTRQVGSTAPSLGHRVGVGSNGFRSAFLGQRQGVLLWNEAQERPRSSFWLDTRLDNRCCSCRNSHGLHWSAKGLTTGRDHSRERRQDDQRRNQTQPKVQHLTVITWAASYRAPGKHGMWRPRLPAPLMFHWANAKNPRGWGPQSSSARAWLSIVARQNSAEASGRRSTERADEVKAPAPSEGPDRGGGGASPQRVLQTGGKRLDETASSNPPADTRHRARARASGHPLHNVVQRAGPLRSSFRCSGGAHHPPSSSSPKPGRDSPPPPAESSAPAARHGHRHRPRWQLPTPTGGRAVSWAEAERNAVASRGFGAAEHLTWGST